MWLGTRLNGFLFKAYKQQQQREKITMKITIITISENANINI